jgi:hypothetical protein
LFEFQPWRAETHDLLNGAFASCGAPFAFGVHFEMNAALQKAANLDQNIQVPFNV